MIPEDWRRMCGIHFEDDGSAGAVWVAHERVTNIVRLYDAAVFHQELFPIIADGLISRGRWIPIAWEKKQKASHDQLYNRGCNMISEPFEDSDSMAQAVSNDIESRMRTHQFRVGDRIMNWIDERKSFLRKDDQVPRSGFPLMSATRYAMGTFDEWARPERMPGAGRANYPDVAVL